MSGAIKHNYEAQSYMLNSEHTKFISNIADCDKRRRLDDYDVIVRSQ